MSLPNTHFGVEYISTLMKGKKRVFFDGIGGVSMCSLAEICKRAGHDVSGYDKSPSAITHSLEAEGIRVFYDAKEENVRDADLLVYTLAMPADSPEYVYAGNHGIPRVSRADFLGYIMSGYTHRLGIAGTHGKSTTTGMVSRILGAAGAEPTVFNGAMMKESASYNIIGKNEFFAFEACEYMDSFLDFSPTSAVVLNIELDHVDYFSSLDQIKESFARFMALTGENGTAVVNANDKNSMDAAKGYSGHLVTFGCDNPDADYTAGSITLDHGMPVFTILYKSEEMAKIRLRVPGVHNVNDALAACAVCHAAGIPASAIEEGLNSYDGICRRMEKILTTPSLTDVYTDYAHHPTEIRTTLAGACGLGYKKVKVIFQPHTFSRTKELFDGFVSAFAECDAEEVILCDIYPARETNIYGISSDMLCEAISAKGKKCIVIHSIPEAAVYADKNTADGDMILIMGAGDVIKAADKIKEMYQQ